MGGGARSGQCPTGSLEMASPGATPEELFVLPNLMLKLQTILNALKGFRTIMFLEALVIFLSVKVVPLKLSVG